MCHSPSKPKFSHIYIYIFRKLLKKKIIQREKKEKEREKKKKKKREKQWYSMSNY